MMTYRPLPSHKVLGQTAQNNGMICN